MSRYLKRPAVGVSIAHATGPAVVLASRDNGRTVQVRDAIGRTFTETRAPAGWWVRTDNVEGVSV